MLYCACAPLLCHLCPLCHHDMEGGGGGRWHGMPCNGSCRRGFGTCVTCVTCAGRATMTRRGGGRGGGGIGKCAATRVVTWVSSQVAQNDRGAKAHHHKQVSLRFEPSSPSYGRFSVQKWPFLGCFRLFSGRSS